MDKATFCYECHEELLHNPVLLPDDIKKFAELVELRGLNEIKKKQQRKTRWKNNAISQNYRKRIKKFFN